MISDAKGFTLVECLVATVILMVGLLGLLQTMNLAMAKSMETAYRNEALQLAGERMMNKRSKTFESISTTTSTPPGFAVQRVVRSVYKSYSGQEVVGSVTDNSKNITVNVFWSYNQKRYSHAVSSVVSRVPVQ